MNSLVLKRKISVTKLQIKKFSTVLDFSFIHYPKNSKQSKISVAIHKTSIRIMFKLL